MTGWYLPSSGRVETCLTLGAARRGWYLQQGTSSTQLKVMGGWAGMPCRRTNNPANQSGLVLFSGRMIDGWMHGKGLRVSLAPRLLA